MAWNGRIAIIGVGKMGESVASALLDAGLVRAEQLIGTVKHETTLEERRHLGIELTLDNAEAARKAETIILAVKPQGMTSVLESMKPAVTERHLLVSTAAGVTTTSMQAVFDVPVPVVRAMPNTPCLVRCGMTALSAGAHATDEHLDQARAIFDSMGRSLVLDEKHMDAVTGLSGSGPAFMYVVLEALAEGGVKVGLPRKVATELIAQTMLGAARLVLETNEHPAMLKDAVTTPAGCTMDGLLELEAGGLRVALIKAVVAATQRAGALQSA